jgi:hypothetical protein
VPFDRGTSGIFQFFLALANDCFAMRLPSAMGTLLALGNVSNPAF